jgi:hypothetical protein
MPYGPWLGPSVFVVGPHIDDLKTVFPFIKFIDDVTVIEIMTNPVESNIQVAAAADQLAQWSAENLMVVIQ